MWCSFPDLNWARLRVYEDGSSDVYDIDGRLIEFSTVEEARAHLWEDEYSELNDLSRDDELELGIPLTEIKPPTGESDIELLQNMFVRFESRG